MEWWNEALAGIGSMSVAYVVVFAGVRLAGRRTVSQMSAFDVVVTIAIGSLLAQTSTSGTGLVRGLVGVAVLVALQALIAWVRRRFPATERWIEFSPRIVARDGRVRNDGLAGGLGGPQMTEHELAGMLREQGVEHLGEVRYAVLEPTGELSVLRVHGVPPTVDPTPTLWTSIGRNG